MKCISFKFHCVRRKCPKAFSSSWVQLSLRNYQITASYYRNKFLTKMQSSRQIFDNLIGLWTIKRVLGDYGTAEGIAKFTLRNKTEIASSDSANSSSIPADENTSVMHYREDLQVKYDNNFVLGQQSVEGGIRNTAYQEYVYLYDAASDKIIKKFTSGGLFYELSIDFEKQMAFGDHLCVKDFYKATYSFKDPQNFCLSYYVKGPEKDYLIQTEFSKKSSDSTS